MKPWVCTTCGYETLSVIRALEHDKKHGHFTVDREEAMARGAL